MGEVKPCAVVIADGGAIKRVVGPFKNAAIAMSWVELLEKRLPTGLWYTVTVATLEPAPPPVAGADYYGGPVARLDLGDSNPQVDPYD